MELIGGIPETSNQSEGFLIPVFREEISNLIYCHFSNEYTGRVARYEKVSGIDGRNIKWMSPMQAPDIGELPVFMFLPPNGEPLRGNLQEIGAQLLSILEGGELSASVAVQVAELVGDSTLRISARRRMREFLRVKEGEYAATSFYEISSLRSALWDGLLKRAPGEAAANRFLRVRSMVVPVIDGYGSISVDVSAASPEDHYWLTSPDLIGQLQEEFSDLVSVSKREDADLGVVPPTEELLSAIGARRNQEVRIALLLRAILTNPDWGLEALRGYRDKSKFGEIALNLMRSRFGNPHSKSDIEVVAAAAIHDIILASFPMHRGRVLLALAQNLSRYSTIADALSSYMKKTASRIVDEHRSEIMANIRDGLRRGRPSCTEEFGALLEPGQPRLFSDLA